MSESLKNKAVKGVAWNSIRTFTTLGINFVVGILLARKLMPSDYGAVAMIGVFTSVLTIFTDGGLTLALVRKENRTEADKATVFYYNIVACYLIYGLIYLLAPFIADFYNMPELCKLTRIVSLGLLVTPLGGIHRMMLTTAIDFKTPAIIGIIANLIMAVIALYMAYTGYGVYALAVPSLFSVLFSTLATIAVVRWKPTVGFSWSSFKDLFAFSNKLLSSQILDVVYNNITPLIVGKFFSSAQLGVYERAKGWPALPSQTFTSVLQGVTFPVLSKMQDDTERLAVNYRRILKLTAFLVFPMMVGLAAVARPLTIVVVTEKWIDSVILMQLVCFSMMWYPIHAINLNLLQVTGRSDYFLKLEVIKKIWGLLVMACALPFGLIPFCAAGIFSSYVSLFINTWYTRKIINLGFTDQMKDLLPILCNCLVMGALCWSVQLLVDDNVYKLLLAIPVGILYYVVSARYFNAEQIKELIDILKRR